MFQESVTAHPADATVDMTMVRKSVAKTVTHYAIIPVIGILCEETVKHLKGVNSIVVIGVYYPERLVNLGFRHHNSMTGSPGFLTPFRHLVSAGKVSEILKNVINLYYIPESLYKSLPELLLYITPYDKYHLAEPGPPGIIDRIINNRFAGRPDLVKLFIPAISAAHPGSKNH